MFVELWLRFFCRQMIFLWAKSFFLGARLADVGLSVSLLLSLTVQTHKKAERLVNRMQRLFRLVAQAFFSCLYDSPGNIRGKLTTHKMIYMISPGVWDSGRVRFKTRAWRFKDRIWNMGIQATRLAA